MDLRNNILQCISIHLFVCSHFVYTGAPPCDFYIQNLVENGVRPSDIVVYHTMDIGTNVFTANVVDIFTGLVPETKPDILMPTSSSNYDLISVDNHQEVVVQNCLQAGTWEFLAFQLDPTFPYTYDDCGVWILETYVEPSTPDFNIPASLTVNVTSCLPEVDVFQLKFQNGGNCSSWNCSVNCTNDATMFLTEGRMIRTSRTTTTFNFTYEIRVTCFDETAGSLIGDTIGDTFVDVTFVDAAGTCSETTMTTIPTTTTMSEMTMSTTEATTTTETTMTTTIMTTMTTVTTTTTTTNQGVVSTPESVGFFQSPTNAALVACFGGVLVGLLICGAIYLAAKYCARKSAVGNSLK